MRASPVGPAGRGPSTRSAQAATAPESAATRPRGDLGDRGGPGDPVAGASARRSATGAPQGRNGHAGEDPCRRCSPGSTQCASAALPCAGCAPGGTRSTRLPGVDACAAPLRSDPVVGTFVGCVGGTSGRSGCPRRSRAEHIGAAPGQCRCRSAAPMPLSVGTHQPWAATPRVGLPAAQGAGGIWPTRRTAGRTAAQGLGGVHSIGVRRRRGRARQVRTPRGSQIMMIASPPGSRPDASAASAFAAGIR